MSHESISDIVAERASKSKVYLRLLIVKAERSKSKCSGKQDVFLPSVPQLNNSNPIFIHLTLKFSPAARTPVSVVLFCVLPVGSPVFPKS